MQWEGITPENRVVEVRKRLGIFIMRPVLPVKHPNELQGILTDLRGTREAIIVEEEKGFDLYTEVTAAQCRAPYSEAMRFFGKRSHEPPVGQWLCHISREGIYEVRADYRELFSTLTQEAREVHEVPNFSKYARVNV